MQPLQDKAVQLKADVAEAVSRIGLNELRGEQKRLAVRSKAQNFWENPQEASAVMQQLSKLEKRISPWQKLIEELEDMLQLIKLDDPKLLKDLEKQLAKNERQFSELKQELKFIGTFDDHNVLLSIFAGAGGTDAQDWTQNLLKMYSRWADQHGYKVQTITESAGDEAGLKSVTIGIDGDFVYGKLRGEHGVHRLVRLSPFNANHLRETSFAKVEVLPKIDQPQDLELDDKDLQIDVFRSGGHGGQSVNTTDSAVRVTHLPTGITIVIQNERSQLQNKDTALTILRSRLAQLQLEQHQDNLRTIKGPNQSAEWGNQIRSYVLHPYKQVKDLRTKYETSNVDGVLKGDLDPLLDAYIDMHLQA